MRIAVYCSAKDQISEEYKLLGDELGAWIGQHGHTLVYGGATGGLMTRVSQATKQNGGKVIGVFPTVHTFGKFQLALFNFYFCRNINSVC